MNGVIEGAFTRIFSLAHLNPAMLALQDPEQMRASSPSAIVGAWRCLLASMALRRRGLDSEANDFLNHASSAEAKDDILSAEVLSEAGLALQKADRLADAGNTLDSASAIWQDACDAAAGACGKGASPACSDYADRLLKIVEASGAPALAAEPAPRLVRRWLIERAAPRRADVYYGFATLLARTGQADAAREVGRDLQTWMESPVILQSAADGSTPVEDRVREASVRQALYKIRLARGEIELADGRYQESADAFADAARMYDGYANDPSDVVWLLQAKFNQANSLLRLARWDEALKIYALVEHGFERFADDAALQRVKHAILFARMKKEESSDA